MNFSVSRDNIFKALQKVINVIPSKSTVEILYNVLISSKNNTLSITATDLEITQISWTECTSNEDGDVTVPGKLLLDIIRELPNVNINFSSDQNHKIIIKSEMGEYKLSGEDKTEFPSIPAVDASSNIKIQNNVLKKMIEKTIFACSTDHFRPALTGVLCQVMDSEYRMVATDGHRLVKIINKDFQGNGNKRDLIIPTKALNFVARNLPENGTQQITLSENHVLFELPDTKIYSRIINEPYPDYDRVIPADFSKELEVDRNGFISSVKRVSLFSNPITSQIKLSLSSNNINVSAQDIDFGGEANENISCKYTFENLDIAYNANYLIDILRHMDSEKILLKVNDADGPALIFPDSDNEQVDLVMLIMPVRIN
ncbi:MAG: DNA polymerase III subunit beta [Calditrichae bacterium]|nr:DNA polymerase III subunit beta [Calditrichota bacterium]MCB9057661.1 DNA polymerase III subunit beta [Calditrichia bacterium]